MRWCETSGGGVAVAEVIAFPEGGYRYISGVFQYSAGVAAEPGFVIERARFRECLPMPDAFAAVAAHLAAIGRPLTAFAACELRSPAPFTEQAFVEFNRDYVQTLERWGLYRDGVNPVARTNVCPEPERPATPSMRAFSYTLPAPQPRGGFIVAGGAEAAEGSGSYSGRIVREGETSADAMREKLRYVVAEMARRLAALGYGWRDATSVQVYTVHDIGALVGTELAATGVAADGFAWHYARPPVTGLEFEMDVRGADRERVA
jgi:hypothetical protein